MKARRLDSYGKINKDKNISFTWDNKKIFGFEGDSLASALLANNINIVGRSFKYHRPRGIMSAGVEESGALVTIGRNEQKDPNVRATTQELYEGLNASGQNAFPNVNFDFGEINNYLSRFFSAGFYYKTFMGIPPFEWGKGTSIWMFYEKFIRKAAGMGTASKLPDPDSYEHANEHCDVLIIGSGPAGSAAAIELANKKLDVILVEQDSIVGGNRLSLKDFDFDNEKMLLKKAGVKLMTRTTAFGLYDNSVVGLLEKVSDHFFISKNNLPRQRFWTIRSKQIILATGAIERHIAFNNNDKPGIMTTNAALHYLHRYGILCGNKIIIATNNDSVYATAAELSNAGSKVHIIDCRKNISEDLRKYSEMHDIQLSLNTIPYSVKGNRNIKSLEIAEISDGKYKNISEKECNLLLVSGGWSPVIHLISHTGLKPIWNSENLCFISPETDEPITVIGSAAGIWNIEDCIKSGKSGAYKIINLLGIKNYDFKFPEIGGWKNSIMKLNEVKYKRSSKSFIDFQHDVTTDDIRLAHREGFVSVEHLKRYTTLGMANDQGKMGNVVGLGVMSDLLKKDIAQVGTTTFRPPYTPVSIGSLAGRNINKHFRPLRLTSLHHWNLDHGAVMIETGLYQRPWYYPKANETLSEAYIREADTVRKTVGICDVTSLGKISIQGPDSTEFLNRIYTNPFAKLAIGKTRYGIMLRDDGLVMDDGTAWRLSEDEYFMTTSTAQAAKVMAWLEELLQVRWTDLMVHVSSVSEQWAAVSVAGPKSRDTLSKCLADPKVISNENLPFMGFIETKLKNGVPCKIARISFSGELAFEVYSPSDYGPSVIDMIWESANSFQGCLYGLEALGALRVEKGHVTGAELDGRVTIDDAGLGKMASTKKSYVGSAMRKRGVLKDESRETLVGIYPKNRKQIFDAGTIICEKNFIKGSGIGRITSVTYSPELGHWIGLGFIKGGHEKWKDMSVVGSDPVRNKEVELEIVSPHMIDPEGKRMHG